MTFAVLLTGSRSIAFGSGIQGGRGVLAIINSQFIGWCPPFGSFGLVTGAVDNDSPETLLTLMLAFPAEFIVASAPPAVSGNKFPLEDQRLVLIKNHSHADGDLYSETLLAARLEEEDFFCHVTHKTWDTILHDIGKAHEHDIDSTSDFSLAKKMALEIQKALATPGDYLTKIWKIK